MRGASFRVKAVFPGRFDPVTNGHMDLIHRALDLVDELVVGVFDLGPGRSLFPVETRVGFVQESLQDRDRVEVIAFSGLLTTFVREQGARVIVRGLRAVTDFSVEFDQALMYKTISPDVEQIYLMSSLEHIFLSASRIREVAALGYEVDGLVPTHVATALRALYAT